MRDMYHEKVAIKTKTIQLDQFLKWAGLISTGGEIKPLLEEKRIRRNGEIETAKRRQLSVGDIIEIEGVGSFEVVLENTAE